MATNARSDQVFAVRKKPSSTKKKIGIGGHAAGEQPPKKKLVLPRKDKKKCLFSLKKERVVHPGKKITSHYLMPVLQEEGKGSGILTNKKKGSTLEKSPVKRRIRSIPIGPKEVYKVQGGSKENMERPPKEKER